MKTLFLNVLSSISLICNSIRSGLMCTFTYTYRWKMRSLCVVIHTESYCLTSAKNSFNVWMWLTEPVVLPFQQIISPLNTKGNYLFFLFLIIQSIIQQFFTKQKRINQGNPVLFFQHHADPCTGLGRNIFPSRKNFL